MKKIFINVSLIVLTFLSLSSVASAADVNLTIRDGSTTIFSGVIPLQPAGTINLNGHPLDADSVLSIVNDADILSPDFSITNLQYSDSFGSFYLKCITGATGEKCDNWQYWVGHTAPRVGMDKIVLLGGENIYLYFNFGSQHKVLLSSNAINTSNSPPLEHKFFIRNLQSSRNFSAE